MEYTQEEQCTILRKYVMPTAILQSDNVLNPEQLMLPKRAAVSFRSDNCAVMQGAGSALMLDFGRELCGGIRRTGGLRHHRRTLHVLPRRPALAQV
jgi:hypothetical protein